MRLGLRLLALLEIVAAFVGLIGAAALLGAIVPHLPAVARMPVQALGMWGAVLAGGLLLWRSGRSWREIGLRRPESWRTTFGWTAAILVVAFAGTWLLGMLIQSFTDWPPLDVGYIREEIEGNFVAFALWMVLVVWGSAAFGEELFFRGFMLDRLSFAFGPNRAGIAIAIILQAAQFGALHAIQGTAGIVITAWVGLVMAVAYFASGRNLWAPILAHGITDTISLTLMYFGTPLPGYID